MKPVCICIHGHFYQPPRENAWIEAIELQDSAHPYHDWNERIYHECYRPNTRARIFNDRQQIVNIVNNFERMSFNVGPTLMSWLEEKHPETYRRILAADKTSVDQHHGHGNALAQVYNHMIMPLASRRDKVTQVRWGVADFKKRFGRDPEGIWLAETAVNEETLEVLAEEGMHFTILAPHQAEAVRAMGGEWRDAAHGNIDPRRPYRCFLKKDPARFVDIFFYDGPISKAVAFEDLLSDTRHFMGRLESAVLREDSRPQLIHAAADGETYGHHKPWAERSLAYLLFHEAEVRGYRIVNYAEFLAENPPVEEVRLQSGDHGEGTSWSCEHGVKRWKQHCGCRGVGPAEWRQDWRKPLRESLDWLRDAAGEFYGQKAAEYLKDPWRAREEYIQIILNRSEENSRHFFEDQGRRPLSREEMTICLKLLEMQRHAQLMYTSCGWFFTEISGIETVQILQYAARVCQLARLLSGGLAKEAAGVGLRRRDHQDPASVPESLDSGFEEEFLKRLAEAKSNVASLKDGRGVYEKLVRPRVATLEHLVGYYAIGAIFENYYPQEDRLAIHCFHLQVDHRRKETFGNLTVHFGRARVSCRITLEENDFIFAAVQIGLYDFRCSIKTFENSREFESLEKNLFDGLYQLHLFDFMRKVDELFGAACFALKDLLQEDRLKMVSILTHGQIEKVCRFYERIYEENRPIHAIYSTVNLPVPEEFRYAAEYVLSRRLNERIRQLGSQGFSLRKAAPILQLIETARSYGVEVRKEEAAFFLSQELVRRARDFTVKLDLQLVRECMHIQKLAQQLHLALDCREAQDDLFFLMKSWNEKTVAIPEFLWSHLDMLVQLMRRLGLSVQELKQLLSKKMA